MSTKPRFLLQLPDSEDRSRFAPLVILLEALVQINEFHLLRGDESGRPYPKLYKSGIYYREEKPGYEDWPDVPTLLRQGWGDCEDLAAYRAAELRVMGIQAQAVIKWKWIPRDRMVEAGYPTNSLPRDGIWLVHCLVQYPDGSIEDPSKKLGMKGEYS